MIAPLPSNGELTVSSVRALVSHCLSLRSLPAAESLHARLVKAGLHRHTFSGNCIQDLYTSLGAASQASCAFRDIISKNVVSYNILLKTLCGSGRIRDARRLFDEMPHRDSVSFNTMVSAYASNGDAGEAFEVLRRMRAAADGLRATVYTYSIAAALVCSTSQAKELHASFVRNPGPGSEAIVAGNSLIAMYGRLGLSGCALKVFSAMEYRDTVTWNSMISASGADAFGHFDSMRSRGFSPDEFTMSAMISVCAGAMDLHRGEQLVAVCFKSGWLSSSIVSGAAIDMYSRCGWLGESVRLFEDQGRCDSALCNSMASGYARNGLVHEALGLFAAALAKGVKPTEFSFAAILSSGSCCGLAAEQGTQIHCWALKTGLDMEMVVASSLVDMYAKLGLAKCSLRMFSAMDAKDLLTWNTAITGLAQNGKGAEVLWLFREMQNQGHRPDRITLFGVLSACGNDGLVAEGWRVFASIEKQYGIEAGSKHYTCMADILGRAGLLREALDVIRIMPEWPDSAVWELFIEHCNIHGDLWLSELVSEKLVKSGIPLPLSCALLAAQAMGKRGKWESMSAVLKELKKRGLRIPNDCSWICIKGHVSTFRSDQLFHCGGEDVYSMSRLLAWEVEAVRLCS